MKYNLLIGLVSLFFPSQILAEWDFNLQHEMGNVIQSNKLIFPVTFTQSACQFTFEIKDDNNQIVESTITHTGGCVNNHRVILDDYWYEWDAGFSFIFEAARWIVTGGSDVGNCTTTSGNSILTGSPFLFVEGRIVQIDDSKEIKYFTVEGISYISLKSANADIVCDNGTFFTQGNDIIFRNGFDI